MIGNLHVTIWYARNKHSTFVKSVHCMDASFRLADSLLFAAARDAYSCTSLSVFVYRVRALSSALNLYKHQKYTNGIAKSRKITLFWILFSLCINGDSVSQRDKVKFDPSQNRDPSWTNCQKIVTVDYVRETIHCAKFRPNPPTGSVSVNRWNITEFFSDLYLFTRATLC